MLKKKKKEVSNDEYNKAYYNKENQIIIKAVLSKYKNRLDEDTLNKCGLNALWRCLQNHDYSYVNKFTSSLWRFTHWECKKELQILAKNRYKPVELLDNISIDEQKFTIFDDLEYLLSKDQSDIIKMRYLNNMTLEEIGNVFGYTKEAARQNIQKAINNLKEVYKDIGQEHMYVG